jgi:uncharacterized membrane protein
MLVAIRILGLSSAVLCGASVGAHAADVTFQSLGDLSGGLTRSQAFAISDDASAVVGTGYEGPGVVGRRRAFRRTDANGMQSFALPFGYTTGHGVSVSSNGSVVVGYATGTADPQIFLWTAAGGLQGTGVEPTEPSFETHIVKVSGDGSTIIGQGSVDGSTTQAYRWSTTTGAQLFVNAPGGVENATLRDVNFDGSVIVGSAPVGAFRWHATSGLELLRDTSGAYVTMYPEHVSNDGATVFGSYVEVENGGSEVITGYKRFKDGVVETFPMGTDSQYVVFQDMSADGSVAVGARIGEPGIGIEAVVWDAVHGVRSLADILAAHGVSTNGTYLYDAMGVSADGTTIVGLENPNTGVAWMVTIPEPASALGIAAGGVCLLLRRRPRAR